MRPKELGLAGQIEAGLRNFNQRKRPLPGIQATANRKAFVEQLIESIRRIRYVTVIKCRPLSNFRADPSTDLFDPLKAAVLYQRKADVEEAFWLVFVFVHFGKNRHTGWRLARDVYGRLGSADHWNWTRISSDPKRFREWLSQYQATLRGGDGVARQFGNHRKYQSLDPKSDSGTGAAFESYVKWVSPPRTHQMLVQEAQNRTGGNPRATFHYLYRSMKKVASFGRTARFDYLAMVGKLGLARIEPGSTFLQGATGPVGGARLLFGGDPTAALTCADLDAWLVELERELSLGKHGMQVLEDALCNWQKSPTYFVPFRG